MPRRKEPCKRCNSKTPGVHEAKCRYAKAALVVTTPAQSAIRAAVPAKIRKRTFIIDHLDGETVITVIGPAGAVKCRSTEQSLEVWTGENAPQQANPTGIVAVPTMRSLARSTDVSRSGEEYTTTDELNSVPGGLPPGMTEEEAISNPDAVLERMRLSMIGRMSAEASSSDVLLVPEGAN